jgi:hypothetical protein
MAMSCDLGDEEKCCKQLSGLNVSHAEQWYVLVQSVEVIDKERSRLLPVEGRE